MRGNSVASVAACAAPEPGDLGGTAGGADRLTDARFCLRHTRLSGHRPAARGPAMTCLNFPLVALGSGASAERMISTPARP
jgi:hypothetical protein